MSDEQVTILIGCWPKEYNVPDLVNEQLGDGEKWEKGEEYFLQLADPKIINEKLKMWHFKAGWNYEKGVMSEQLDGMKKAFNEIMNNKMFLDILGMALTVGNVLNGGNAQRGQADGFDLPTLGKLSQFKDVNGKPLIKVIVERLAVKEPEFTPKWKEMVKIVNIKNNDLALMKAKINEVNATQCQAKAHLDAVRQAGISDNFTQIMTKFVEEAGKDMEGYKKSMDDNEKMFEDAVVYFGVDKNDDMAKKSPDFFKFFVEFFQSVEKNLPKEEKKRAGARPTGRVGAKKDTGGGGDKPASQGMNAFMAEIQAKKAAKAAAAMNK